MRNGIFYRIQSLQKKVMRESKKELGNALPHEALNALASAAHGKLCHPDIEHEIKAIRDSAPYKSEGSDFRFVDLFCGIGGIRLAAQQNNGSCVFSSEWDRFARETYFANYGEYPYGDINNYAGHEMPNDEVNDRIPDHELLLAGFPCQPFSQAGVTSRRSLGRAHGFECKTQGTLFFNIAKVIAAKRPKVVLLENVRNLVNHDKGHTFNVIKTCIEELGYSFNYKLINANTRVPQSRVRCYMVALRDGGNYEFPDFRGEKLPLQSILEDDVSPQFTISEKSWQGHVERTLRNAARGVGFSAKEAVLDKPSNTITARYYKDGKECLIPQQGKPPRMLTPRECARLQGFPEDFAIHPSKNRAYRQFGNSVAVPVVAEIIKSLQPYMR